MEALIQDLRTALRQLVRSPGFAAVAVLILALGIGATTATFSVVRGILLRPLPYPDADRLVLVWTLGEDGDRRGVSPPDLTDLRESGILGAVEGINSFGAPLTGEGEPRQLELGAVTAGFLTALGVRPLHGRGFRSLDDTPLNTRDSTAASTIILSHELWRAHFGARPDVLGRTIRVGGTPMEVVGILPPDFRLRLPPEANMPRRLDAFTPLRVDMASQPREARYLKVVGRLDEGTSVTETQAGLDALALRWRSEYREHRDAATRLRVVRLHADLVAPIRATLLALMAAVLFVLLIACANVANLLLARAAARERETAVRAVLGAGGRRLARECLAESLLLGLAGTAAGILLAWLLVRGLPLLGAPDLPGLETVRIDGRVLGFAAGLAILTPLLFGLAPALHARRTDLVAAMGRRSGARGIGGRRLRDGLAVAQVALSLLLLAGAGLALRSALHLQAVDPGFHASETLAFRVDLPFARYPGPDRWADFFERFLTRLGERAEVDAVAAVDPLPLSGEAFDGPYNLPEEPADATGRRLADYRVMTPGAFRALGIRLLRGREFAPGDGEAAEIPVVVDAALAAQAWPGRDPVGRPIEIRVATFEDGFRIERRDARVVGLAADVRYGRLTAPSRGTIYLPYRGQPLWTMGVVLTPRGGPADGRSARALEAVARAELAALDPLLPIYELRPLTAYVEDELGPARFAASAVGGFAGAALLLAAVGLYGVLAFLVRRRWSEIGIRLALGATPGRVLRAVVGRGLALASAGVCVGLLLAAALGRTVAGLLYEVEPTDAATLAGVSAVLLSVALLASWLPARRAARVNPVNVLKQE